MRCVSLPVQRVPWDYEVSSYESRIEQSRAGHVGAFCHDGRRSEPFRKGSVTGVLGRNSSMFSARVVTCEAPKTATASALLA
jgi:hypothetical protein